MDVDTWFAARARLESLAEQKTSQGQTEIRPNSWQNKAAVLMTRYQIWWTHESFVEKTFNSNWMRCKFNKKSFTSRVLQHASSSWLTQIGCREDWTCELSVCWSSELYHTATLQPRADPASVPFLMLRADMTRLTDKMIEDCIISGLSHERKRCKPGT